MDDAQTANAIGSQIADQAEQSAAVATQPLLDPETLEALAQVLVRRRDKAVTDRRNSGIEEEWREDEESYQGIDDANRHLHTAWTNNLAALAKRGGIAAATQDVGRSTVFINITRPYVEIAASRLADMLLPVDDRCWEIKPTPIATLDPQEDAALNAELAQAGVQIPPEQLTAAREQRAAQIQAEAGVAADKMTEEIDDHLVESNWHGEVRAVIEDAARIGSGVIKGPVPTRHVSKKWTMDRTIGEAILQIVTTWKPGSRRVDPWNFYPEEGCGENIANGSGTWERQLMTPKQLRDMRSPAGGYFVDQINTVLKDGPKASVTRIADQGSTSPPRTDSQFEAWEFYGSITADEARSAGLDVPDDLDTDAVDIMALLVNDRLVKIGLNALETGDFPYDVLAWQRRPGLPWGSGIGRHIRTPQRMLNASARAMMDNAGDTAGGQTVVGNGVTPEDGNYRARGRKTWRASNEVDDVRKAFFAWVPESHQAEFMAIIEFAERIAELTTGMPILLQGMQSESTPKTLGGQQLMNNNASSPLRRLAKRFDDGITEPHIRRYYSWFMQFSPRPEIKGDFQIDARGSSALVERDANKQFMYASMAYAKDPEYGIDPYKLFSELAKADRFDPTKIQYDEAHYKERMSKPPSDLDQAKTELARAQALNEQAKATLAKVEAIFSAIQTANAVALNPAIAPAADETAKSAGFQDANAPPIVSEVPPGAPATPALIPPGNTHPTFPPNPQRADVGALQGVEGGAP